ncbi:MAG: hypothetical protein CUN53_07030 [Phototrophicales bacterium]|nr:MAG: hypothetical protein CUN53_07030 [Phototrophicales bacterium]
MGRYSPAPSRRGGGLPPILVFLIGAALVFGMYYLLQGAQTFLRTGGLGVVEATRQAEIVASATQQRATRVVAQITALPSATPQPTCTDFRVIVPSAIVRDAPSPLAAVVRGFTQGEIVCVLWRDPGSDWYTIDRDRSTRRRELAYMHESVIAPVNPTATLPPTTTPLPTLTPSNRPSELPTEQPSPTLRVIPVTATPVIENAPTLPPPPTLAPSITPKPTIPMQSA